MAEHIYTYLNPPSEKDLSKACQVLDRDGIIAYPTDVNWAFGCNAASSSALEKIRKLKPFHPKEQPFALICCDISMASSMASIDNRCYRLLKQAWPGPFTVLLPRNKNLPKQIKDKRPIVGIRIPNCPLILALVKKFGKPLATTSVPALAKGEICRMGWQVAEHFGHGLDLILDLGEEVEGSESTIIDLTKELPILIRRGSGDPKIFNIEE